MDKIFGQTNMKQLFLIVTELFETITKIHRKQIIAKQKKRSTGPEKLIFDTPQTTINTLLYQISRWQSRKRWKVSYVTS